MPLGVIRVTRLDNGARVVTETMAHARSVTTGFWVGVGARDEPPEVAGASHFLEHLLFKGTDARTAAQIAEAVDSVGGEMNAFTAHEHTAYHTRLPASQIVLGLDILSDVLWAPAFRAQEVDAEREVILGELAEEEDAPDDRVLRLLDEATFPGHPIGSEVLGTKSSIESMTRDDIAGFHDRWYTPANVVVAAAGALDHDQVVDGVDRRFSAKTGGEVPVRKAPVEPPLPLVGLRRRTEATHIGVAVRGLARGDEDRYALVVANQVLGGGMSSRLFQNIREQRGLAYTIYSFVTSYSDCGSLAIHAACAPARAPEVLGLIHAELDRLCVEGITDAELAVAKGYLEGATLLDTEDPGGCMARIAHSVLATGSVVEIDEVVARFRAVTRADVHRVVARVLEGATRTVATVGPAGEAPVLGTPSARIRD